MSQPPPTNQMPDATPKTATAQANSSGKSVQQATGFLAPDHQAHSEKSERTLLVSWLLSAPGPLVTGIAVAMSSSATQIADTVRRTVELVALFTGWWVFRRRKQTATAEEKARLERRAAVVVAVAMALSGVAMLSIGVYRFFRYEPGGNVIIGLIVAVLGILVNGAFWVRYSHLLSQGPDAVIVGQRKLYRAKTLVDLCVVAALLAVAVAPSHPATHYIDTLGSVVVALYLFQQAFTFRQKSSGTNYS